jgi:phage-related protein
MNYEVIVLVSAKEFLDSLDVKLKAKSFRTIQLLCEFGPFLSEPHSKKVSGINGLFELRVIQGNNICRFFYFHDKEKVYVITSGFIKKDQKLKKSEIDKALKIFNLYKGDNK